MKKIIRFMALLTIFAIPLTLKAQTSDEIINAIAPNNIVEVEGIEPNLEPITIQMYDDETQSVIPESYDLNNSIATILLNEVVKRKGYDYYNQIYCDDSKNCHINLNDSEGTKTYDVTLEYKETDETKNQNIIKEAKELGSKFKTLKDETIESPRSKEYILTDLNLLNYMNSANQIGNFSSYETTPNFVPEMTNLLKNNKFTLKMTMSGCGGPLACMQAGSIIIYYNNIPVHYEGMAYVNQLRVIYIPESTEKTKEAYIEAALKRIKESFPNTNIEIEYNKSYIDGEFFTEEDWNTFASHYGLENSLADSYTLKFMDYKDSEGNPIYYDFTINPNDKKINTVSYEKEDPNTKVIISSSNGEVPLDTLITVEDLTEVKEVLEEVKEQITTTIHKILDISLYSETKKENITKLDSGLFKVTIPLGEDYIGKNLKAYYIDENKEVEEHEITMDEFGNASFETNHFSTYIIAESAIVNNVENQNIENPNTLDNINYTLTLFIASLISLFGLTLLKNKYNN